MRDPNEIINDQQTHFLKISKKYFDECKKGCKKFEVRKNDRDYQYLDTVILQEYENETYTGRELAYAIGFILQDYKGLEEGYCAFTLIKSFIKDD